MSKLWSTQTSDTQHHISYVTKEETFELTPIRQVWIVFQQQSSFLLSSHDHIKFGFEIFESLDRSCKVMPSQKGSKSDSNVANTRPNKFRRPRRRFGTKISLFNQSAIEATGRGIESNSTPCRSSANDQHIKGRFRSIAFRQACNLF
jgi:hypothetical protein